MESNQLKINKIDSLGNRLRSVLKENKMKPVILSKKTGIDKAQISNYLSNKYTPKKENLAKIAKLMNVSEDWLSGLDVPKERQDPLLDNNDTMLTLNIMSNSHTEIEKELLIKCTMLSNNNQEKVLELVDMYLKNQGDFCEEDSNGKWINIYSFNDK